VRLDQFISGRCPDRDALPRSEIGGSVLFDDDGSYFGRSGSADLARQVVEIQMEAVGDLVQMVLLQISRERIKLQVEWLSTITALTVQYFAAGDMAGI